MGYKENMIKFISKMNYWPVIFLILLSLLASWSLFQPGYFYHHDDLQIMRIFEMDKCFRDGQIPCRWIPDMGFGYGYPLFNYYPVMPYYLGELIYVLGFNLIWSVKINFILSLIVSSLTMYFLAKQFWGKIGGIVSAAFYLFAPYHGVDVFVRGALAESWSIAWAPVVFLYILKVIVSHGAKNIMLLSIFIALFLLSHNPLALVFSPLMIVWAIMFIFYLRKFKAFLYLILSGIWGLGLAAFFTLPVLLESQYVHIETLFIGYFNYLAHFVGLNQLFISTFWGYGGSIWGTGDTMSLQIGWLHWGGIIFSAILLFYFLKKEKVKFLVLAYCFVMFWGTTFLIHPRSNFIWERVTLLQNIQFPWRILSVVILFTSLGVGALYSLPVKKKLNLSLLIVTFLALGILYFPYFRIEKPIPLTDKEKLSGALWDLQRTAGIFDYLPKSAKFPPGGPALESIEVLKGDVKVYGFQKRTDSLKFISESTNSATLRLPIIDFPEWRLFVDGKRESFDNKNDLGQPTFEIQPGRHEVYAKLFDTQVRIIANLISLISLAILIYLLIKLRRHQK